MKQKPVVIYIQDNVERKLELTIFQNWQLLEICSINEVVSNNGISLDNTMKIKENIQLVHFKNVTFEDIDVICCNSNTICILEECSFKMTDTAYAYLTLKGGEFELINPRFNQYYVVQSTDFIGVNVLYTKEIENRDAVNFDFSDKKGQYSEFVTIKNQNADMECIETYSQNVSLQNHFEIDSLSLRGECITVGDSKTLTMIKSTDYPYQTEIVADKKLKLINCCIDDRNKQFPLKVMSPQVEVENVMVKTREPLSFMGVTYFAKDSDEVIVRDIDISRANLIQFLKGYHQYLEDCSVLKAQDILQSAYDEIEQEKRRLYQEYLKLLEQETEKEHQLAEKKDVIIKSLSKRKVKNF